MKSPAVAMLPALWLVAAALSGCNIDPGNPSAGGDGDPVLELRADAVTPPAQVKVVWTLDGVKTEKDGVEPGTLFNLGKIKPGTKVVFQVFNTSNAGVVRSNILTDNCFRNTASCNTAGCTAKAEYVVTAAGCINE